MNKIVEQSILDATAVREMINNEVKGYVEQYLEADDLESALDEKEMWEYIRRLNEENQDDDDDDYAFDAAAAEIKNVLSDEDDYSLQDIVNELEDELDDEDYDDEMEMDERLEINAEDYVYSEDDDIDEEDEELDDDPIKSKERSQEAFRQYNLSRAYKRPFEGMQTVYTGGNDIKVTDNDRKALMLHAGLIQPDKTIIAEGLRHPFAIEMRKKAGIDKKCCTNYPKQLLFEWKIEDDFKQKQQLNG